MARTSLPTAMTLLVALLLAPLLVLLVLLLAQPGGTMAVATRLVQQAGWGGV